jgi:hypothetical protein
MKRLMIITVLLSLFMQVMPALAAPLRLYVSDMNAIGVQNKDEMKATLQMLLASRLNSGAVTSVGSAAEAEVVVTGTYVTIGKVFSIDALARTTAGKTLGRAFVQGENQDELIPAVGKLADKLRAELERLPASGTTTAGTASAIIPATAPAAAATKSDIIKNDPVARQNQASDIIKPVEYERYNVGGWLSKRLNGAANLIAVGKTLSDGGREIFLAEDRKVSYYRQSGEMKLVAEIEFRTIEKILSLDTIESGDGGLDVYVTILRSNELASKVLRVQGDKLVLVAENLPYYFRAFSLAGDTKKLYAQSAGRDSDYFGGVAEATRNGSSITLKNSIQMPRYGNIYSFNQVLDKDGKRYTLVIDPENYLIVYNFDQTELWRSNDKFGGSELYFVKDDSANVRVTLETTRWVFLSQRIQVTAAGDVLVGKNDGFWVLGNARMYKKGSVYCMFWNGSSLEEKWRTRDTQNYMPDYWFDEGRNELYILQTVQRPGINDRGASSLSIKKVE